MTVGENIKSNRKDKNLTQGQLADMLGVKQNTVAQWENGRTQPSLEQLKKIAEALNVSPVSFLPDGWDFLQEHSPDDDVALQDALTVADTENKNRVLLKEALHESKHTLKAKTIDIPVSQLKSAICDCLLPLNQEGLLEAYQRVYELSKIKDYRK
ncbi:helix-turn-helix domain-containing protein [Clostridia bacterium OttesenSCG-928-O13]|nr:helix-turn-helix domain-containing protein [Clostridia bacterium OttesenSCG-928-O13]